jgi:hypothetical protein
VSRTHCKLAPLYPKLPEPDGNEPNGPLDSKPVSIRYYVFNSREYTMFDLSDRNRTRDISVALLLLSYPNSVWTE